MGIFMKITKRCKSAFYEVRNDGILQIMILIWLYYAYYALVVISVMLGGGK